jgi:hypothetical protein
MLVQHSQLRPAKRGEHEQRSQDLHALFHDTGLLEGLCVVVRRVRRVSSGSS